MESRSETLSATDVVNNLQIRPCDRIHMPVSYREIAAEKFTDTQYTLAEDPAAYSSQAQQMSLFDSSANGPNSG